MTSLTRIRAASANGSRITIGVGIGPGPLFAQTSTSFSYSAAPSSREGEYEVLHGSFSRFGQRSACILANDIDYLSDGVNHVLLNFCVLSECFGGDHSVCRDGFACDRRVDRRDKRLENSYLVVEVGSSILREREASAYPHAARRNW